MRTRDAYNVECPRCGVKSGERCIAANSARAHVSQPHHDRIKAYVNSMKGE